MLQNNVRLGALQQDSVCLFMMSLYCFAASGVIWHERRVGALRFIVLYVTLVYGNWSLFRI